MPVRANAVLAAAVGGIAVLAVVAGVVAATREPAELDPGSPEGVVQEYLSAIAREDITAAAELLVDDSSCDVSDLAATYLPPGMRATLLDTDVDGGSAVVRVEITESFDDGPFAADGYSHVERLLLEREGSSWRLTGSPWPIYGCEGADA